MKTFEQWWEEPKDHSDKYNLVKSAYEAGQRSALPELTEDEWEKVSKMIAERVKNQQHITFTDDDNSTKYYVDGIFVEEVAHKAEPKEEVFEWLEYDEEWDGNLPYDEVNSQLTEKYGSPDKLRQEGRDGVYREMSNNANIVKNKLTPNPSGDFLDIWDEITDRSHFESIDSEGAKRVWNAAQKAVFSGLSEEDIDLLSRYKEACNSDMERSYFLRTLEKLITHALEQRERLK